jgi:hypothetical protein
MHQTHELLKKPQIHRDQHGRFDRHGKTLAKTAKKTAKNMLDLKSKNQEVEVGKHGGYRPGAGRPPGARNMVTRTLKEAILAAGEIAGGEQGMTGYLARLAVENSSAYAGLLGKVLPTTLAASESDGGAETQITFTRIIVHADGRREIQGVTPRALPAPDTSPTLPRATDPTDDTNEGAV